MTAPADPNWKLTETLLQTLNQELGGLKEYVLTDLRGEITALRSQKLQLQTEIQQLRGDRDQLQTQLNQLEQLQRDQRAPAQAEVERFESLLKTAIATLQQDLSRHQSDLSQQLLRMQALEHQGEVLLETLVQRIQLLQSQRQGWDGGFEGAPETSNVSGLSSIASILGAQSGRGLVAELGVGEETPEGPPEETPEMAPAETLAINDFPADIVFGKPSNPGPPHPGPPLTPPPTAPVTPTPPSPTSPQSFEIPDPFETPDLPSAFEPSEPEPEATSTASALPEAVAVPPRMAQLPRPHPSQLSAYVSAACSLCMLALQYCTVQVIFHGVPWLKFAEQGLMDPTWASALLTFWVRMLMVLPFMLVIGHGLYPPLLEEIQELFRSRDRRPLVSLVFSSLLLFFSQFLLYGAIANSSASVAVGLLFVYPAAVQVFGWSLFGRSLTRSSLWALLPIGLGGLVLLAQSGSSNGINPGIISALCFSLYVLFSRLHTRRLNLLTLTVLQFGLAWLFSMPALFFLRQVTPRHDIGYVLACLVLSATVFLGYFFNAASLMRLGPAWTTVINGWAPLLVALGGVIFSIESLSLPQGIGVLLVTLGVTVLNLDRLKR